MPSQLDFKVLARALGKQFMSMIPTGLFVVDVDGIAAAEELLEEEASTAPTTDEGKAAKAAAKRELAEKRKESLTWKTYLGAFPPGTDPIYRTKTEHDCSCCRSFLKKVGGLVTIQDGKLVTVWDFQVDGPYGIVAAAMAALVRSKWEERGIRNEFFHKEPAIGVAKSNAQFGPGTPIVTFDHFNVTLPAEVVKTGRDIGSFRNLVRTGHDTFLRALTDFPLADVDTVLDLMAENKLDCGKQFKPMTERFRAAKAKFDELPDARAKDLFAWTARRSVGGDVVSFRGSVIGSLFQDLASGIELPDAVMRFGKKVDPRNYKQPSGIASKTQIENGKKFMIEHGYMSALERRYAVLEDIPIQHALHVSRGVKKQLDVFDDLKSKVPENAKSFDRAEEMDVEKFVNDVLPRATSVEVFVENGHEPNFMSITAAADPTAKCILKHGNDKAVVYNGDLADSVKLRVKEAGGNVTGDLRVSLAWWNADDLDLRMVLPDGKFAAYNGYRYPNTCPKTGASLDVDMNAGGGMTAKDGKPVENIVIPSRARMLEGEYVVSVNNFCKVARADEGFTLELEFQGKLWVFDHHKSVANKQWVEVVRFTYSKTKGLEIVKSLAFSGKDAPGRTIWNTPTQTFRKANVVMWSPNYWDGAKGVGNKHLLFLLDGCVRDGTARGFLNEHLIEELDPYRHVMQAVGAKMRTEASERQLSGVGFSTARRDGQPHKVLVRVGGSVQRTIRVVI